MSLNKISGDDAWMDPPVPIPNTVVKHPEAESTCLVTGWEDRKLPVRCGARLRTGSFVLLSGRLYERHAVNVCAFCLL